MDHSDMDHGHGDMDMGDQCSMNMLFTFSTKNLCIVFRQWRVTGPFSLLLSIIAVILLTAGYEAVRELTRRYEASSNMRKDTIPSATSTEYHPILHPTFTPSCLVIFCLAPIIKDTLDGFHARKPQIEDGGIASHGHAATSLLHENRVGEETSLLLPVARTSRLTAAERRQKITLAALYAVQVFYSFFIMLLFMTYNGWIMLSVAAGAFVGYMLFDGPTATKSVACH